MNQPLTYPQACALRRQLLDERAKAYHNIPLDQAIEAEVPKRLGKTSL